MHQSNLYNRNNSIMFGNKYNRQSPALTHPLPDFTAPSGARGQDIMIIWDMQNVRIPTELEPVDVIRFLYNTFVMQPGPRRCAGAFCTFTDNTKKAIGEKRFNQFCSNGVLNFMMINSPGGPRKADDSDHPLKEMMMNFTVDCVRGHKDGVLLLITADADFVRPAIWCKQQGCVSLELLYYDPIASKEIRQLEATWKMEWRDFLDCSVGRRCAWTFPYPQDVAAGLVPNPSAANSSNAGFYSSSPLGNNNNSHGGFGNRTSMERPPHQQQPPVVAGYLPAPQRRLALPSSTTPVAAAASTAARQAPPAAAAAASAGAVQVSTAHVQQAAAQLLHNPAALHQVVQQYKQSVQTTAVLQQVLQGVAQAATVNVGVAQPAAAAAAKGARLAAAAAGPSEMSAGVQAQVFTRQQQQGSTAGGSSAHSTPVKQHQVQGYGARPVSGAAGGGSSIAVKPAAAAAAGESAGLTWQQLEQQQNDAAGPVGGFNKDAAAAAGQRGKIPLTPQWWTTPTNATSSSAGKTIRLQQQQQQQRGDKSSAGSWDSKVVKYRPEGWASEEEDEGFWDSVTPDTGADSTRVAAAEARLEDAAALHSSAVQQLKNGNNRSETSTLASEAGNSSTAAAAGAGSALPPAPSMGLLKRAGVPPPGAAAAAGSSTGINRGSSGALAALFAGAAAKAGINSGSSNSGASNESKQQYQSQHMSAAVDSFSSNRQQGSSQVPVDLQQQQPPRKLLTRASSPGINSRYPYDQQQQQQQQQRSGQVYDRHQQHHDLQVALLERQKLAERQRQQQQQQQQMADTPGPSVGSQEQQQSEESEDDGLDELERALLQRKRMAAAAAAAAAGSGAKAHEDQSVAGNAAKRSLDPHMLAAARMFQKASVEAAAGISTVCHSAAAAASSSSSRPSGVVVLAAPPPPAWMLPLQQQDEAAPVQQQQQQECEEVGSAGQAPSCTDSDQDCDDNCLIDEETGEVIILKPKMITSSSSVAAARQSSDTVVPATPAAAAAAAAAVRPRHVRVADADLAAAVPGEGSSSKGSNSSSSRLLGPQDSSLFSPALTDPPTAAGGDAAFKDDSSSSSGSGFGPLSISSPGGSQSVSRCSSTAAAGLLHDEVTTCYIVGRNRLQAGTDSGHMGCSSTVAAGGADCSQVEQQFVRVHLVVSAPEEQQQQQQQLSLVRVKLSIGHDAAADDKGNAVAVTAGNAVCDLSLDDGDQLPASRDLRSDRDEELEISAAAAAAAAALAASSEALLEELEGQQAVDTEGPTAIDLDGISITQDHDDLTGSTLKDPDDQGLPDVPTSGFCSSPVAAPTGMVLPETDDFVASLVRNVSGGATPITAAMDLDLQTLEEIAAARSAASADLMAAAAAAVDVEDCYQQEENPSPLDSPAYGLETLDLYGEPITHHLGPVNLHNEDVSYHDHDLCTSLGLQCPMTSTNISSAAYDLPFGLNQGSLPIPMPLIQPAGFSGPSGFGPGAGRFRAASPVTAIEELGNASSNVSSSRASVDEPGTTDSSSEEDCSNADRDASTAVNNDSTAA